MSVEIELLECCPLEAPTQFKRNPVGLCARTHRSRPRNGEMAPKRKAAATKAAPKKAAPKKKIEQVIPKNIRLGGVSLEAVKRTYTPLGKRRKKRLAVRKKLACEKKAAFFIAATEPHLKGAMLKAVAISRADGRCEYHYYLVPKSEAACKDGHSTTARRLEGGKLKDGKHRAKELLACVTAAAPTQLCCAHCPAKFGGINPLSREVYAVRDFEIDHHTDEVDSADSSLAIGVTAAELADGVAQVLCLFCARRKGDRDSGARYYQKGASKAEDASDNESDD